METQTNPTAPKSWAPEVIADSSGKWCGNQQRFASEAEAKASARDLFRRWTLCTDYRAAPSDDPPSHAIVDGELRSLAATDVAITEPATDQEPPEQGLRA